MCGIVGLHLKNEAMHDDLGRLLSPMLDCMSTRGPEAAGVAIYDDAVSQWHARYSVRIERDAPDGAPPETIDDAVHRVAASTAAFLGSAVEIERIHPDGAVLIADADVSAMERALAHVDPQVVLLGYGSEMEIIKATGAPIEICRRYDLESRRGFQGIGHTRMATESAVTSDHSHPFAPNPDLAVVHNGSFSNHATVRRRLEHDGIFCVTNNDTEVAARLIGRELAGGAGLATAMKEVGNQMDGFYTLLVSHSSGFAVVRDAVACKPLVVAEHPDYVAVASEYSAMADLPGIEAAAVFEPMPGDVHAWEQA